MIRTMVLDTKSGTILPVEEDIACTLLYHHIHEFISKIVSGNKKPDTAYVLDSERLRARSIDATSLGLSEELHNMNSSIISGELSDTQKIANMTPDEEEEFWSKQEAALK